MKIKILLLTLFALVLSANTVFADSPLTSTEFYKAYAQNAIIKKTIQARGQLTPELLAYLTNSSNPIALKMAVINGLGWSFKGKNNAPLFLHYLIQKKEFGNETDFRKRANGQQLICYAYLKALDNYFDVNAALQIANLPQLKTEKSLTIQLIRGLINAQQNLSKFPCAIYTEIHKIQLNKSLKQDLNTTALKIIFEYVGLYKVGC